MLEFIKMFGLGIMYTILSPVILVFFLLFVIYSFFNYLVCESIYLGGFFMGKRFDDKTSLEKKLEKMRKENKESVSQEQSQDIISEDGDLHV